MSAFTHININSIPSLPKTFRFDERFETDWRFTATRKVFFAMGYEPFFELLTHCSVLLTEKYSHLCWQDGVQGSVAKTFQKVAMLKPRFNQTAEKHCDEAVGLIKLLIQYWQIDASDVAVLKKTMSGEILMRFNDVGAGELQETDVVVIGDVFNSLSQLFFMMQWMEIGAYEPQLLPKPNKSFKDGNWVYDYGFC